MFPSVNKDSGAVNSYRLKGSQALAEKKNVFKSKKFIILLYHFNVGMATAQFRFDTQQLVVAGRRSRPAGLREASFSLLLIFQTATYVGLPFFKWQW
jgi:hypothetical protein